MFACAFLQESYFLDGVILKEYPDGSREVVSNNSNNNYNSESSNKLKNKQR